PALKMVVNHRRYLSFYDVDFKALSPSTFIYTLLSLNALRGLGLYSVRNQTFAQINDRLLLGLAKNGLRSLTHRVDINPKNVTGDISGRGIIKFLTFDDAPSSLEVNHPRSLANSSKPSNPVGSPAVTLRAKFSS
ncbi:hypothetical protein AAVH_40433, partial [Aphelenchoides avenae]